MSQSCSGPGLGLDSPVRAAANGGMFRRIVVGVDGRNGGRDAVALAVGLADATGAGLVLAQVVNAAARPTRATNLDFERVVRADAEALLTTVRAAEAPDACIAVIADASPARGLHRLAAREHASLLVVGSARRSRTRAMLAGSVVRAVLHRSPCPVAVAPRGFAAGRRSLLTIGVGVDRSPIARHALLYAASLAEATGAALRIIAALPPVPASGRELSDRDAIAAIGFTRAHLAKLCDELGIVAEIDVGVGEPVQVLQERSRRLDLLIVGSHDMGVAGRLLYGSVSNRLVRRPRAPVLVVGQGSRRRLTVGGSRAGAPRRSPA